MVIELRSLGGGVVVICQINVQTGMVLAWKMNYFAVSSSNSYFSMKDRNIKGKIKFLPRSVRKSAFKHISPLNAIWEF